LEPAGLRDSRSKVSQKSTRKCEPERACGKHPAFFFGEVGNFDG